MSHEVYKVSVEAIRKWFHSVGKILGAIYTYALWVYVDETKIKKRRKYYYLWLAVDEEGKLVYVSLTSRSDSWTARVVLKSFTKGSLEMLSIKLFGAGWFLLLSFILFWRSKVDMVLLCNKKR